MGLLEELKGRYQKLGDEADGLNARLAVIRTEMNELFSAISALESAADLEEPGLREVRAYTSGRLDGYEQAIAALTPAPVEAEPGIPDALGEFMKREGAVTHDRSDECPVHDEAQVEVFYTAEGYAPHTRTGRAEDRDWFMVDAYRIISEPAAGEGEATEPTIAEGPLPEPSDYFPTQPFTIGASKPHADESAALAPLLPPEPPKPATPEQLEATGVIDGTASWWARKLAKEPA